MSDENSGARLARGTVVKGKKPAPRGRGLSARPVNRPARFEGGAAEDDDDEPFVLSRVALTVGDSDDEFAQPPEAT